MTNVTRIPTAPHKPQKQREPDYSAAGFGRRLNDGLDALDVPERERPAKVAEAAGVTIRTARRYLRGESQPRGAFAQIELADALGIAREWLVFDRAGFKTKAEIEDAGRFIRAYQANPPWRQRLIERTVARMANKSPRVERLMALVQKGQLSDDDFLRLAGR